MHAGVCQLPLRAFVDAEYLHWLPNFLPPRLLAELRREFGDNFERIPWDTSVAELFGTGHGNGYFDTHLVDAMVSTHDERLSAHGMTHSQQVTCACDDCLVVMQRRLGTFPGELYQSAVLGYSLHDRGHPGATFFATAKPGRIPPGATIDMPVEVYTAGLVDDFLRELGKYGLLARLVANYVVISSAFGAINPHHGKRLQLERVQPRALLGTLMRIADVLPSSDFTTGINYEAALMYLEVPAIPAPTNWRGYLESRARFLKYVQLMMDRLDAATNTWLQWLGSEEADYSITHALHWNLNVRSANENLAEAGRGGPKSAALRARLYVLGVALD